jgi:cytochrome c
MKWTVVEVDPRNYVDYAAELFHESLESPVGYYMTQQAAWDTAAYLNDSPLLSEFLLSMQKDYVERVHKTEHNYYQEGYADGISGAINYLLDKIEEMLAKNYV